MVLGPEIPFITDKAFFPIRPDLKGFHYPYRTCTGKIIFGNCVFGKWVFKETNIMSDDEQQMGFMKAKDFGLCKRPMP